METYNKAMDKLRDEMAATKDGSIQQVGEIMSAALMQHHGMADAILATGKTLKGAFNAMQSWASKHKNGNSAYVGPKQSAKLIGEYYGVEPDTLLSAYMRSLMGGQEMAAEPAPQAKPQATADALDLDALLGGL